MRISRWLSSAALALLLAAPAAAQVSLWDGESEEGTAAGVAEESNLLRKVEKSNFQIHDIIRVIVQVSAESTTDEATELEKSSDKNTFAINQYLKLRQEGLKLNLEGEKPEDLGVDATADKEFEGEGAAERTDTLRTRLAAEIVDIRPNGHLVIEATSKLKKNRETTTITLSGVVRPEDVSTENTVYSYDVAGADIRYESSGPVSQSNERGWLLKLVDKIWPF